MLAQLLSGEGVEYRHADTADFDTELDMERRIKEASAGGVAGAQLATTLAVAVVGSAAGFAVGRAPRWSESTNCSICSRLKRRCPPGVRYDSR